MHYELQGQFTVEKTGVALGVVTLIGLIDTILTICQYIKQNSSPQEL